MEKKKGVKVIMINDAFKKVSDTLDSETRRNKAIEYIYDTYEVIDVIDFKGQLRFVVK